jgi:curved DNA-binding protein CbpA
VAEPRDPYRVLGVSPSSPPREIRDAYRRRARMAHPDLAGDTGGNWMRDLNAAWEILKDPEKRAAYDASTGQAGSSDDAPGAEAKGSAAAGSGRAGAAGDPWDGAAGPPPATPYGTVLTSGIYAGWSLAQVARRDRGYLTWLLERPEGRPHRAEIERILGTTPTPDATVKTGRRGRA